MTRLLIDDREVDVPAGSTILDAARKLGVDIPTLCYLDGLKPPTSCMICQVKVKNWNRGVPSCATLAEEGMEIESETEEIRAIRRAGLELLLSDHVGDCTAPCQNTCPAHMDIPLMLRQVAAGELRGAIATVKSDIALPAVLGRVCPELCERTCRRRDVDSPASICLIKRHVADVDLASETPYLPACRPSSGKKTAIIGAGPTGLAAAYHLLQLGHACTLYDQNDEPGGVLRRDFDEDQLPRRVLDAEIAVIERMGGRFRLGVAIRKEEHLTELRGQFDAVLVAMGRRSDMPEPKAPAGASHISPEPRASARADSLPPEPQALACAKPKESGSSRRLKPAAQVVGELLKRGIEVDRATYETSVPGVFAAGDAVQPTELVIRNVAAGKAVAFSIDQHLRGATAREVGAAVRTTLSRGLQPARMIRSVSRFGRLTGEELVQLRLGASDAAGVMPSGGTSAGFRDNEARADAQRCLHCDCGNLNGCRLRKYAQEYGVVANRYRGTRRAFERHVQHGSIVYEPGKCILCGLCVQIASEAGEPLGLTFVGRGFDVRVGVPFDGSIDEGLTGVGMRCAQACPTGALVLQGVGGCSAAGCHSRGTD